MAKLMKDYLLERIEIDSCTHCWNWIRAKAGRYGVGWFDGKKMASHRASYIAFIGEIPDGMNVCHKCDNPICCNPSHLFVGTQKENMVDCSRKGRFTGRGNSFKKGENHKMAKLSNESVICIRNLILSGVRQKEIAARFAIHQSTVSDIKRGKHWKHTGDQNGKMQM